MVVDCKLPTITLILYIHKSPQGMGLKLYFLDLYPVTLNGMGLFA
jgi:hypothetical protein